MREELEQARAHALNKLDNTNNASRSELLALNRIVANSFILGQVKEVQQKAIPYLESAATYATSSAIRHRILSLAALLSEDPDLAVSLGEKALAEDPADFKATNILANAYIQQGHPEEAIRVMNLGFNQPGTDFETRKYGQAWVFLAANDPKAALARAEELLEVNATHEGALAVAIEAATQIRYAEMRTEGGSVDDSTKEFLLNIVNRASKLIGLVSDQRIAILASAYSHRATCRIWLAQYKLAAEDLLEANKLTPGRKDLLHNLASAYLVSDRAELVPGIADEYLNAGGEIVEAAIFKARAHLLNNRPDQALEVLTSLDNEERGSERNAEVRLLQIEALDQELLPEQADEVLNELRDENGEDGYFNLAMAERFDRLGEHEDGVHHARRAIQYFSDFGPFRFRSELALANNLFGRGQQADYEEAAKLYREHASLGNDGFLSRRWAKSLFLARDFPGCLQACREIQGDNRIETFTDLEASVYLETENFSLAADRLKWLARERPSVVRHALNFGYCLYRLGETERAYQTLRMVAARVEDSPTALMQLSVSYAKVGRFKQAVEFGYKALSLAPEDHRVHQNYISLFLGPHERNEVDIEEHLVKAFQASLGSYKERFPEYPFFEEIRSDPNDLESLKNQMIEMMGGARHRQLEELFRRGLFPLSFLATAAGKDILAAWGYATSSEQYGLLVSTGNLDREKAEKELSIASDRLVIDPPALVVLYSIQCLEAVAKVFDEVLIPQAFVDDLGVIIDSKKRSAQEGEFSVYINNGELYRHEVSAEQAQKYLEYLEGFQTLLHEDPTFTIIGQTPGRDDSWGAQSFDEQVSVLGKATTESMLEARSRDLPLLAADVVVRHDLVKGQPVQTVGIVSVLEKARESGSLSESDFLDALNQLIEFNCRLIPVSSDLLSHSAKKAGFVLTSASSRAMSTLADPRWLHTGVAGVFVRFLKFLWRSGDHSASRNKATFYVDGGALPIRRQWTWAVLDVLAKRVPKDVTRAIGLEWKNDVLGGLADYVRIREYVQSVDDWFRDRNSNSG